MQVHIRHLHHIFVAILFPIQALNSTRGSFFSSRPPSAREAQEPRYIRLPANDHNVFY